MLNIYKVPTDEVTKIEWKDDFLEYDRQLSQLGNGHEEFLVVNPEFEYIGLHNLISSLPPTPGIKCIVWKYKGNWVAKYFRKDWKPELDYWPVRLYPELIWERNPDISESIPLLDDPSRRPIPDLNDLQYEMIWYIDPKYNPTSDKVWILKCRLKDSVTNGTKDMGYVSPKVRIQYNPDIKDVKYNFNLSIPWYDLNYEHVWYLDERFNPTDEKIWAIKVKLQNGIVKPLKDMGYVSPKYRINYNPAIPKIDFAFNLSIPWYDLNYEHVWYLDERFNPTDEKIWAIKFKLINGIPKSTKDMGYVSPQIIYNPELPVLDYTIDDCIPYYDLQYEHIWTVNDRLIHSYEEVWAAKTVPHDPKGTKIVGNIKCNLPDQLDVVFISYNEPNAEANWQRVLTKAPNAKRVDGVKGIVAAHKQAASLVNTDMFYVVDGDAELADYWDFKFQPNLFDRDCVHVWRSINPINDLKYGHGGVKLFPTKLVLTADHNNTDMTTSLSNKFKLMPKISNTTAFNCDEFSTWRSAFRECAKLAAKAMTRQLPRETEKRLDMWCTTGADRPHGKYAIAGAIAGRQFGEANMGNPEVLKLINDYDWLRSTFDPINISDGKDSHQFP